MWEQINYIVKSLWDLFLTVFDKSSPTVLWGSLGCTNVGTHVTGQSLQDWVWDLRGFWCFSLFLTPTGTRTSCTLSSCVLELREPHQFWVGRKPSRNGEEMATLKSHLKSCLWVQDSQEDIVQGLLRSKARDHWKDTTLDWGWFTNHGSCKGLKYSV